ncbi:Phosphoglucomutase, first 3 domain-containing protein [Suillus weaverae]|nr:Phosphoglucomutase, first 3 domain-containing protein [Suillus weaverae]
MSALLEDLVKEWLRLDPNESTRKDVEHLWNNNAIDEMERRMRTRIEFGTAGLRGKMEAGWSRMNDLIVIQASQAANPLQQGLCAYVLKHVENAATRGVVVGHDHRHNSERWAQLTAAAFIANNAKVYLHNGLVHTPMVPFSVKALNAACGVMITASHNPKQDNGYKVYWENAVQIIGPHDVGIAQSIMQHLEPRVHDASQVIESGLCIDCTEEMKEGYFRSLSNLRAKTFSFDGASLAFVNTSMHGVGDPFTSKAFEIAGFTPYTPVKEQQHPDPEFPTVKFPNPEEKGALDLAIATANTKGASYVLAQDPDADRFSAAENCDGKWVTFTGDQLGTLFAYHVFETYKASSKPIGKLVMVASTVSSKMIEAMAQIEGFRFVDCLTGFKFIGNTALDLVQAGYEVPFGYEEAIGYMFGSEIRDKDGVAATMVFAQLAASLRARGTTVSAHLQELYRRYGYFETSNSYFICTEPLVIENIFRKIRSSGDMGSSQGFSYPSSIGRLQIQSVVDLTEGHGYDSTNAPTYQPKLPLSLGHMIQFRASSDSDDSRIVLTIRTSGTEPKIKYYLEGSGSNRQVVHSLLGGVVDVLAEDWMNAAENGLGRP